MSVTAAELRENLGKYLLLAEKEDVYITQSGRIVAKLTKPGSEAQSVEDRVKIAESLFGILPATVTLEEAMDDRSRNL